jgi:flagellar capping protein FliD
VLTAASGVNMLGTLTALSAALASNNMTGINQSITDLTTAQQQVSSAQADVGSQETALNSANDARSDFETQLTKLQTDAVGADTVTAASALAQAQTGFTAATDVAQLISQMADKNIS